MLLEILFTSIILVLFGFFKLPRTENGKIKYERFFKSPVFPEFILLAYFLSLMIRALFLAEMSFYLSTVISFMIILVLFKATIFIGVQYHQFLQKLKNNVA